MSRSANGHWIGKRIVNAITYSELISHYNLDPWEAPVLNDYAIRSALDTRLNRRYERDMDTVIRHELGVENGGSRVDVAALNGHLTGWEIKSDADTLVRLPNQAASFGRVMDYMTIVTTRKYLDRSEALLPPWWGVMEAVSVPSGVRLINRRSPHINRETDAFCLAQLLWREEAMGELRKRDNARGLSSSPRYFVWERLAQSVPKRELRKVVLTYLKQRHSWSGGQLPALDDDSSRK